MNRVVLLTSIVFLATQALNAQDTCKVFSIPNPHGAAMTISRVFIADTVNFSVEPMRAVPFNVGATERWDARVCIKARDGQSHSTTIRYQTTHGQASYPVTMIAPSTASIDSERQTGGIALSVFPTPTSGAIAVVFDPPVSGDVVVRIFNDRGELESDVAIARATGGRFDVDLAALPNGVYVLAIEQRGRVVGSKSVVLAR